MFDILKVTPRISEDEEGNVSLILEVFFNYCGCGRVFNYAVDTIEDCSTERINEALARLYKDY